MSKRPDEILNSLPALLRPLVDAEIQAAISEDIELSFKQILIALIHRYETHISDGDYALVIHVLVDAISSSKNSSQVTPYGEMTLAIPLSQVHRLKNLPNTEIANER